MDDKEVKKLLKEIYDEKGELTEKGKDYIRSYYKISSNFEIELRDIITKYSIVLPKDMFGDVWMRMTTGIQQMHIKESMLATIPPPGPEVS